MRVWLAQSRQRERVSRQEIPRLRAGDWRRPGPAPRWAGRGSESAPGAGRSRRGGASAVRRRRGVGSSLGISAIRSPKPGSAGPTSERMGRGRISRMGLCTV